MSPISAIIVTHLYVRAVIFFGPIYRRISVASPPKNYLYFPKNRPLFSQYTEVKIVFKIELNLKRNVHKSNRRVLIKSRRPAILGLNGRLLSVIKSRISVSLSMKIERVLKEITLSFRKLSLYKVRDKYFRNYSE